MATSLFIDFLQRFRRSALLRDGEEETDSQLLERVVTGRDSVALEILVRRHAPMVWSVCRRTLAHQDEAEDAFQATFLVLLRKAASIRSRELLANWLYGVAHKTARKALQMATIRGSREKQVELMPDPQTEPYDDEFGPEVREWLDEEVSRLPEKYRAIIVLCDLQSRTRPEVARQLRLPEGTVGSRLARGRAMLAQRMSRHGPGVSATSVAAVWSRLEVGSVPAALLSKTIKAASLLAAGQTTVAGMISARVSLLTLRVLQGMAVAKLTKASVLLVMAALVLAGGTITYGTLSGRSNKPEPPPQEVAKANTVADVENYGSAAGAWELAKKLLYYDASIMPPLPHPGPICLPRTFEAKLDRETHQWTVTGEVRYDHFYNDMMLVKNFKWVIGYNPASRSYYEVGNSLESNFGHLNHGIPSLASGWRLVRTNELGKWIRGNYKKPMRAEDPVSSLRFVRGWRERFTTIKRDLFSYSGNDLRIESGSGVLTVYVDDRDAKSPVEKWTFQFGGPAFFNADGSVVTAPPHPPNISWRDPTLKVPRSLEVGEYGGAFRNTELTSPYIMMTTSLRSPPSPGPLGGNGWRGFRSSSSSVVPDAEGGGEFVVWEIEVKDQKVVRLAIDFIISGEDLSYGSLRVNSRFEHALPEFMVAWWRE